MAVAVAHTVVAAVAMAAAAMLLVEVATVVDTVVAVEDLAIVLTKSCDLWRWDRPRSFHDYMLFDWDQEVEIEWRFFGTCPKEACTIIIIWTLQTMGFHYT